MSEDYFGSGDGSDGSSALTSQIIDSITQLGSAAILSTQSPTISTSYPYGPPQTSFNPITGQPQTGIKGSTLLIFGLIAVGGFFYFTRR